MSTGWFREGRDSEGTNFALRAQSHRCLTLPVIASKLLGAGTRLRFRPEIALTRLQLAELLLAHYPDEKAVALEHLDFAIGELREMKMQPALERALKHRETVKA